MGSPSHQSLEVPQEVAAGEWLSCKSLRKKHVTIGGEFVGKLQVQYSVVVDGEGDEVPQNIGYEMTEPGFVEIPLPVRKVRVNVLAYTSGTPTATLSAEG